MPEARIPVSVDLQANTKDFIKDITIASSKSGQALEKELDGSIKQAQINLKNYAELQKKVLAGSADISSPMLKHAQKLAEASNKLIFEYNKAQAGGNTKSKQLSDDYKEVTTQIDVAKDRISKLNEVSKEYANTLRDIRTIEAYDKNESEIRKNIEAEEFLKQRIAVNNELLQDRIKEIQAQNAAYDKFAQENPQAKENPFTRTLGLNGSYIDSAVQKLEAKLQDLEAQLDKTAKRGSTTVAEMLVASQNLASKGIDPASASLTDAAQKAVLGQIEIQRQVNETREDLRKLHEEESEYNNGTPGYQKFAYREISDSTKQHVRDAATSMALLAQQTEKASTSTSRLHKHYNILGAIMKEIGASTKQVHKRTSDFVEDTKRGFRHLLRNIMRYGLGVRSLYFLFRRLRAAIKETFKIMSQVIPEVNQQVSSLVTNFNLIKANLGTMIQPLLTSIVPAFERLAQSAQRAMEWIAKLFAMLHGQNYIYRASSAWVDYANSVGGAAKAIKNLSSLDELNILDDGKGSGGGIFSPDNIGYEKIEFDDSIFQKIKESWERADFTEIGKTIATKFKNALLEFQDKLPGIEEFCQRFVTSIATGINGFVDRDTNVSYTMGETVAKLIMVGIRSLNQFLTTVNWKDVGAFIVQGLNGFVEGINAEDVSNFINSLSNSISDFILGAIEELNSENFGAKVRNKITEIWNNLSAKSKIMLILPIVFKLGTPLFKFGMKTIWDKIIAGLGLSGGSAGAAKLIGLTGEGLVIGLTLIGAIALVWKFDDEYKKQVPKETQKAIDEISNPGKGATVATPGLRVSALLLSNESTSKAIGELASKLAEIWNKAKENFINGPLSINGINEKISEQFAILGEQTSAGFEAGVTSTDLSVRIGAAFATIIQTVKDILGIHSPSTVFADIANNVILGFLNPFKTFSDKFAKIWEDAKNKIKTPINGIITIINKILSAVESLQHGIADALNSIDINIPDWIPAIGGKSFNPNISYWTAPKIPMLAQGGVIPANKPFLAMLGDQKTGTNIEAPLSTIQDAVASILEPYLADILDVLDYIKNKETVQITDRMIARAADNGRKQLGTSLIN